MATSISSNRLGQPAGRRKLPVIGSSQTDAERHAGLWLNGDVLMCGCPDCRAPMTVRLWLMIADCWQCGTSIELTEEQERAARELLSRQATFGPSSPAGTRANAPSQGVPTRRTARRTNERPASTPAPPRRRPALNRSTANRPIPVRPAFAGWARQLLNTMPAWLISLLFHVILLTILGLLSDERASGPYITLSARVSRTVREGGDTRLVEPSENAQFDLGVPEGIDMKDPVLRRAVVRADQLARDLRLVDLANPNLPDLDHVRQQIGSASSQNRTLATRDPRVRVDMVRREGGTTLTEAAVARGLRWLAEHQGRNGNWSLDRFHQVGNCNCSDRGRLHSDSAATALALLPFLGAGQTHLTGIYRDEVAKGLRWLIEHQEPNGDLRGGSSQYPGMYAHGQAAIVLCEAFLMTGDEALRAPAQKAVDMIVEAQYPDGGWRYYPRENTRNRQGDTSVLGWQLMALQSAVAANLSVPDETLENADHFLDSVQKREGSYAYMPRDRGSPPMTAEALLCRIYLGWHRNHPSMRKGITWMLAKQPPSSRAPNIYYWYYATQTLHHYGGAEWDEWNLAMRDVLVASQETRGHAAGSWSARGPLTSEGGRVYMTALSICCLEVYYRHLPIFRRIDLD